MLFTIQVPASAQEPFDSYTYWNNVQSAEVEVVNRPMYEAVDVITAAKIGIPSHLFVKMASILSPTPASRIRTLISSSTAVTERQVRLPRALCVPVQASLPEAGMTASQYAVALRLPREVSRARTSTLPPSMGTGRR